MPAATSQSELLAAFDREWTKLSATLAKVDDNTAGMSTTDDQTTIKGVIAHRTHWIGLFFTWYEGGVAGDDVQTPAPGYKWNQLKDYNAAIYLEADARGWTDLLSELQAAVDRLRAFIAENSDDVLYVPGLYPWMNTWTLGRWAEASGPSHFRSANTYIRKVLRQAQAT